MKMPVDIKKELSFRKPIPVTKIIVFKNDGAYPVCPKCDITVEREYMHYCDRCGQALDWKRYDKAKIIYIK